MIRSEIKSMNNLLRRRELRSFWDSISENSSYWLFKTYHFKHIVEVN